MAYIEYKGIKHKIKDCETKEQVALAISSHYEELFNHQLIVKSDDPNGYIIQTKTGKKG